MNSPGVEQSVRVGRVGVALQSAVGLAGWIIGFARTRVDAAFLSRGAYHVYDDDDDFVVRYYEVRQKLRSSHARLFCVGVSPHALTHFAG